MVMALVLILSVWSVAGFAQTTIRVVGWGSSDKQVNGWFANWDNPDIIVEAASVPGYGNAYWERVLLMLATSPNPPDIFILEPSAALDAFNNNMAMDLSIFVEREGWEDALHLVDTWKDNIVGIPQQMYVRPQTYNRDRMLEVGVVPPIDLYMNGEWTLDTEMDYRRLLSVRDEKSGLLVETAEGARSWRETYDTLPYIYTFGAVPGNAEGTELYLDSPEAIRGYEWYREQVASDALPFRFNTPNRGDLWPKRVFNCQVNLNITGGNDFPCEIVPYSKGEAGRFSPMTQQPWVMSSSTLDPHTTWAVYKHLITESNRAQTVSGRQPPTMKSMIPAFFELQDSFNTPHTEAVWAETLGTTVMRVNTHASREVRALLQPAITSILDGSAAAGPTLQEAMRQANAILEEYK
jgi:ABC-type glycerol-3-phosphate transport system substrate-binding protein